MIMGEQDGVIAVTFDPTEGPDDLLAKYEAAAEGETLILVDFFGGSPYNAAARFAAARDLRALVSRPLAAGGSFKGQADFVLHAEEFGELPVNLGALGGVKALAAITSATVDDRAKGAQGTQ